MSLRPFQGVNPTIGVGSYIDPAAVVIGDVTLGAESSVWPMAVIRGDVNRITIGDRTNIQDGSILHVTHCHEKRPEGNPLVIGSDVTIGHQVNLHGCDIGDRCLIGMGSIILDGAIVEDETMLGAGTLVSPGKRLLGGYLWVGSPARRVRELTEDEKGWLVYSAQHYQRLKQHYLDEPK